eukprot:GDKH01003641.1.p1 GENE.GDKH01003641.1~~GDKH01003641.1.p1  ORF type:complete len:100 (+),score=2.15 GDKH01003641.1:192-491(+)
MHVTVLRCDFCEVVNVHVLCPACVHVCCMCVLVFMHAHPLRAIEQTPTRCNAMPKNRTALIEAPRAIQLELLIKPMPADKRPRNGNGNGIVYHLGRWLQ